MGDSSAAQGGAFRGDSRDGQAAGGQMTAHTRPRAEVVGMRTNGDYINAVQVVCAWCGGKHWHNWDNEADSFRTPTCGVAGAMYSIHVGTAERVDAMRTLRGEFTTPDDVVGLVPLHIGYC